MCIEGGIQIKFFGKSFQLWKDCMGIVSISRGNIYPCNWPRNGGSSEYWVKNGQKVDFGIAKSHHLHLLQYYILQKVTICTFYYIALYPFAFLLSCVLAILLFFYLAFFYLAFLLFCFLNVLRFGRLLFKSCFLSSCF